MTIHEVLVTVLVEQFGVDVEEITPRASLVHDLGADSLDCIEIAHALEEILGIEIGDEEIDEIGAGTVGQAVTFLEGRVQDHQRRLGVGRA
jgi:acyl carrier protein